MSIKIGTKVVGKSSPGVGTVTELWRGKRAYVVWSDGLEAWVPLHALTPVRDAIRQRARDYESTVPADVVNKWAVEYEIGDDQIREWLAAQS